MKGIRGEGGTEEKEGRKGKTRKKKQGRRRERVGGGLGRPGSLIIVRQQESVSQDNLSEEKRFLNNPVSWGAVNMLPIVTWSTRAVDGTSHAAARHPSVPGTPLLRRAGGRGS